MVDHHLYKRLKDMREDHDLSQKDIAELLGTNQQQISRWETGTSTPDITMLPKIASYFDITVDELLGIKKGIKKQKILYIQFRWQKSADVVNKYLDEGWTIKEVQSHPLYDQHPEGVVIIEKVIYE